MTDQRVAVLPNRHHLARRGSLRTVDLRGETLPHRHGVAVAAFIRAATTVAARRHHVSRTPTGTESS